MSLRENGASRQLWFSVSTRIKLTQPMIAHAASVHASAVDVPIGIASGMRHMRPTGAYSFLRGAARTSFDMVSARIEF